MQPEYKNTLNSERSVEVPFIIEMLDNYVTSKTRILDVGGIPTDNNIYAPILNTIRNVKPIYDVCDFRGGKYIGDFNTLNIHETYDIVMFISSLEHFPQCTEGDMIYRQGEDIKGFQKATSLLNTNGLIFLTVPIGKHLFQPYHQNYNREGIKELSQGLTQLEGYYYELKDNIWTMLPEDYNIDHIIYDKKANGVGCFVFKRGYYETKI